MLGLPLDRPIVGRVSALARNKLPTEALECIPLVITKVPNALFVIVGDGDQRAQAEKWVMDRGLENSVKFLGERRDIPQVMRAFDVFAYYTTKDALGNVILEAVASGIPVVTTNVEGTAEALGEAPGKCVPIGALDQFADAVCEWINRKVSFDPLQNLAIQFTAPEMARQYAEQYTKLLAVGAAPHVEIADGKDKCISVLMPIHNTRKDWVREAVESVCLQQDVKWRLVVVDDGSENSYSEWLSNHLADLQLSGKAEVLRLPCSLGVAAALNAGLAKCGEFVARLDSDDRMLPNRLALQFTALQMRPSLAIVGSWAKLIDDNGNYLDGSYVYPVGHSQIVRMLASSCAFAHPAVMFRRSAVLAAGGYRPECRHYEDYDLWTRMAKVPDSMANLPIYLTEHRIHGQSISRVNNAAQAKGAAVCADAVRSMGIRPRSRRPRVIFTGVYNSYGVRGRGLSIEQFYFADALRNMPDVETFLMPADELILQHGREKAGKELLRKAAEWKADMVFTVLGNPELDFTSDTIQKLTNSGVITLNWNCDDHWRIKETEKWAPHYSGMATTYSHAYERLMHLGLKTKFVLTQWACNPWHYAPGTSQKDIDVSFIGQAYGDRPKAIEALARSGIKVAVFGVGWRDECEIPFPQMLDVMRRSKISLNFSKATRGDRRQIKARTFEIPACGTFMLNERVEDLEHIFDMGRHCDSFDSTDELVHKAQYWLNSAERDNNAMQASHLTRSVHTYTRRLHEIFDAVGLFDRI